MRDAALTDDFASRSSLIASVVRAIINGVSPERASCACSVPSLYFSANLSSGSSSAFALHSRAQRYLMQALVASAPGPSSTILCSRSTGIELQQHCELT